jgi:hypothetical protein
MLKKLPVTEEDERQRKYAACRHPDHNPPKEGLEPGRYDHWCDGCGRRQLLTVQERET